VIKGLVRSYSPDFVVCIMHTLHTKMLMYPGTEDTSTVVGVCVYHFTVRQTASDL